MGDAQHYYDSKKTSDIVHNLYLFTWLQYYLVGYNSHFNLSVGLYIQQ